MKVKPVHTVDRTSRVNGHRRPRLVVLRAGIKRLLIFEPDVDEPQTVESLAAQQRAFLAADKQEWVDVDLPSHL